MHMLALPIARRELLVLSRAGATWRNRLGTSGTVFLFGMLMAVMYHYAGQMALSQVVHFLGAGLSFVCLFAGVSLTVDSIAEEKRAGTLGLLLLTHLSAFEIVLGKLVAHGVLGFYTVLCALPLLSMSMIFGGMRFGDVLMYVVSALNILFFSAAAGLFASSVCRDKKRASSFGTLVIIFFWMGLPLVALGLNLLGTPRWLIELLTRLSVNLSSGSNMFFGRSMFSTSSIWWSLTWTQMLGWIFIALAVCYLLRRWQDEPPRKRRLLREAWQALSLGTPAMRLRLRRKLLDRNPFMWLASRDRLQTLGVWIITCVLMALLGSFLFSRTPFQPGLLIGIALCLALVLQVTFSAAAGTQLFREYEQGTLEMVLSTPLSADEVARGQFAAAMRQYRTLFAVAFLLLWAALIWLFWREGLRQLGLMVGLAVYSGLFLLQSYALGWVAMWSVVTAPDPKKANVNAFFYIAMVPGIMFGFIVVSVHFLNWLLGTSFSPGQEPLLLLFFILAFANCIYWIRRAKRELPGELRLFAFRRYTPRERLTLFGQIGRLAGRWLHRTRVPRPQTSLNAR